MKKIPQDDFLTAESVNWSSVFGRQSRVGIPAVIEEVNYFAESGVWNAESSRYCFAMNLNSSKGYNKPSALSAQPSATKNHFDELGSTQFLTGSNATISDKYTYDPWGNVTSHTGALNQPYQFVGQLGYYNHWMDSNVPYIQIRNRFYSPIIGRYTQHGSPYTYSGNNPVTRKPKQKPKLNPKPKESIWMKLCKDGICELAWSNYDLDVVKCRKKRTDEQVEIDGYFLPCSLACPAKCWTKPLEDYTDCLATCTSKCSEDVKFFENFANAEYEDCVQKAYNKVPKVCKPTIKFPDVWLFY